MTIDVLFAAIAVRDLPAALRWCERLWGRPADILVKDDEVMWQVCNSGWVYVLEDPGRAGYSVVTLAVPDLQETVAEIGDRGLGSAPLETINGAGRKAAFTDPDGNRVTFIEVLPTTG